MQRPSRIVCGLILSVAAAGARVRLIKMIELNEAAGGREVSLNSGERVRVTLRESGGTGYRWEPGPECSGVLHLDKDGSRPGMASLPGAGGERTWIYTAAAEGICTLSFRSVRSWKKSEAVKTVSFEIKVVKHGS